MIKPVIKAFEQALRAKLEELQPRIGDREGIAIVRVADILDLVQTASDRELALRDLSRCSTQVREVEDALRRIKEGCYGVCQHCEQDISSKRLNVVPWTPYCISCQNQADNGSLSLTNHEAEAFDQPLMA